MMPQAVRVGPARRLVAAGRMCVVVGMALALAGCGWASRVRDANLDVPRDEDGVETWDLREPPTAEYVGIDERFDEAIFSTLEPRRVRVLLPDGRVIDAGLTTVTFDNHLTPEGDLDPTGMNLSGPALPIDEAMDRLREHLSELGLSDESVREWESEIDRSEDERPIRGGASTTIGYMEIGVGGRYTFLSDQSTLSWGAGWGPGMDSGSSPTEDLNG